MKKYYTPEIEEFHVGFEYESEEMSKCGSSTEMVKSVIKTPQDIIDTFNFNDWHSSIRVKYLDKEDIESLGFKEIEIGEYKLNKYDLILLPDNTYKINENYIVGEKEKWHCIFIGNIKNKSELKKLLKQLNIQ